MSPPRFAPLGDAALYVEFGTTIDEEVNRTVLDVAAELWRQPLAGVRDIVPALSSLAIHVDATRLSLDRLQAVVSVCAERVLSHPVAQPGLAPVEIPVCYDLDLGPDLPLVAERAACGLREVADIHAARTYRVFMLGFLPGFAYMGTLDPRIAVPRHASPRAGVAAGSVGIAGRQTGIYPRESPGGWQIIGRTPVALFDERRDPPALLRPGMAVRFVAVTRTEFDRAVARR